jgi:hypothetical protein
MIDATRPRKDFFIHVGTICVGLLIAVSLEQTIEYLHHKHQLHHFEEALHKESGQNLDKTDNGRIDLSRVGWSVLHSGEGRFGKIGPRW